MIHQYLDSNNIIKQIVFKLKVDHNKPHYNNYLVFLPFVSNPFIGKTYYPILYSKSMVRCYGPYTYRQSYSDDCRYVYRIGIKKP